MRHDRHYTLEEATAALTEVANLLATMRDARERLGDTGVRDALSEAAPPMGEGRPGAMSARPSSRCEPPRRGCRRWRS